MAQRFYRFLWQDQPDRSVAADYLERVSEEGGMVLAGRDGSLWTPGPPKPYAPLYGVVLQEAEVPRGLVTAQDVRPPGLVQGAGERLTLTPRESDVYAAASFLLDRVEGVAWAADSTVLLDSPYAGGSTARARNFAEQFGLTVTFNDSARLTPKWHLRRVRLGLLQAGPEVQEVLNRYHVPWVETATPKRPEFDTVITGRPELGEAFRQSGGSVIEAAASPVRIDDNYPLTPLNAKRLLRQIYLASAYAV